MKLNILLSKINEFFNNITKNEYGYSCTDIHLCKDACLKN
jgi:iron only hydrogenase large subunit-like protein